LLLWLLQKSRRKDRRFSWAPSTSFHSVLFRGCRAGGENTPLVWPRGDSLIFCWPDSWLPEETDTTLTGSALSHQCLLPETRSPRPGALLDAAPLGITASGSV
ncbi:hypothetical protein N331_09485, partial [Merops nubicus]